MERRSGLRKCLSSLESWKDSQDWKSERHRAESNSDVERFSQESLQLLRPFSGKQKETLVGSPSRGISVHWSSTLSTCHHQSSERKAERQQAGKFGVDDLFRKCPARICQRFESSAKCLRREKPESETFSSAGSRDQSIKRCCRSEKVGITLRCKSKRGSVYSPGQTLGILTAEWPADLRVREWPE